MLHVPAQTVPRGQPLGPLTSPGGFSLVSYNVLGHPLALPRFQHVPTHLMAWTHRWRLLQAELEEFQADVVCLQEVETSRFGADTVLGCCAPDARCS